MGDDVGTQEQEPQRAGVWCPVLSGGHDVQELVFLAPVRREIKLSSQRELFWEGQDPVKSFWESTGPYFTFTLIQVREASNFLAPLLTSQSLIHPYPYPPGSQRVWTINESLTGQFFHPSEGSGLEYPSIFALQSQIFASMGRPPASSFCHVDIQGNNSCRHWGLQCVRSI